MLMAMNAIGHHLDHGEHDRIVLSEDCVEHERADSRPRKDRLGDDGAAEERTDLEPDERDDRQQRVAERVADGHATLRESLRARGTHVVLSERLEHLRARDPREQRHQPERERDSGHDQLAPRPASRHGQPVKVHGEDADHQQTEPERRNRLPDEHDGHDGAIEPPSLVFSGDHAGGNADQERQQHGGAGQLERRRHTVDDDLEGRTVEREGPTEVAARDVRDVAGVLHHERLVEAVHAPELGALRLPGLRRQEDERGVSGQRDKKERDAGDSQQGERRLRDAPDDVTSHRASTPLT